MEIRLEENFIIHTLYFILEVEIRPEENSPARLAFRIRRDVPQVWEAGVQLVVDYGTENVQIKSVWFAKQSM